MKVLAREVLEEALVLPASNRGALPANGGGSSNAAAASPPSARDAAAPRAALARLQPRSR
ncbi:MAG: hypothetical protein KF782_15105 [Labilithrix sp.]|nr:hypothetical protein [Labilithrix sp.]